MINKLKAEYPLMEIHVSYSKSNNRVCDFCGKKIRFGRAMITMYSFSKHKQLTFHLNCYKEFIRYQFAKIFPKIYKAGVKHVVGKRKNNKI